jgi:CHAT domain-containing protein
LRTLLGPSQAALPEGSSDHDRPHGGAYYFGRSSSHVLLCALALLVLLHLQDARPNAAQEGYEYARNLFVHGQIAESWSAAQERYQRFHLANPAWDVKFQLLEAQIILRRGAPSEAFRILSSIPDSTSMDDFIMKLALESTILSRLDEPSQAKQRLKQAEDLCRTGDYNACGSVLRARGVHSVDEGQFAAGKKLLLESLSFARAHHDSYLETTTLVNLGWTALQEDHFDEAVDWSKTAYQEAQNFGAEDVALVASGNIGWAYLELGDHDQALKLLMDAESRAKRLDDSHSRLRWLENIGNVFEAEGDSAQATAVYRQALELAKRNNNKDDVTIALEYLAFASVDAGRLAEADAYLDQLSPLIQAESDHGDQLWAELARGRIAALRRQDLQARPLLRDVWQDPVSEISIKLEAGRQLARLDEDQERAADADKDYKSTLATFEQARSELKKEDFRLPFLANATAIYDDYIHFLVAQGKSLEALAVADQSRARTLEDGLGIGAGTTSVRKTAFDPRAIAAQMQSTLLFYWVGEKQSYLWAVTPAKVTLFTLPARKEIESRVENYRKALLNLRDPLETANADGQALYQMLVAPAASILQPNKPAILLDEGVLSKLNFETLLAPGAGPVSKQTAGSAAQFHYLIDDLTLSSAPSLATLAATKPASDTEQRMLLLGNPVSPDREFPSLPLFSFEMARVGSHFASKQIIAERQATPAAYVSSQPDQYSYIHFVSHAVASSASPLDSAIILSNTAGQEDSYKLYARQIIQHPIRAKLVTISACYGSGIRAYAGEGLVGLSWAFLRAGAHKVIGALWEVSDDSTPRLMDSLYGRLANGESPESALHEAKLTLLHSNTRFRIPFYWAPFQIYGGR